tara:strand:- start:164 stop:664 length:501 start_codon:yes stop_codon:yes gene_type:complete
MIGSDKSTKGSKKSSTCATAEFDEEINEHDLHANTTLSETLLVDMWNVVDLFNQLIGLTKSPCLSARNFNILLVAIKEGKRFTESFMKSEKLIGALFVTNTPKTMKVVSQLQKATRQLHSLCSHGKYHKNSQIASEIPTIRKMLEKIIVQMKALGIYINVCIHTHL